jgi:CelD/BcsL family acetyltransferase involved in cellulose biosynthesis
MTWWASWARPARQALAFETVTDAAQLPLLRPEWDALLARDPESIFTQSFEWCAAGMEIMDDRRGCPVHCVTARERGRLALIWPFVVTKRGRRRLARTMGPGIFERDGPHVPGRGDNGLIAVQAWRHLKKRIRADFIELRNILSGSPMAAAIERCSRVYTTDSCRSAIVVWDDYTSWDDFLNSRSRSYLSGLRRKRRRLAEQGELSFEIASNSREFAELLRWTWQHKLEWMKRGGHDNPWIERTDFLAFLETMQRRPEGKERLVLFVMRLDGEPIATELCLIGERRLIWVIGTFDERVGKYSPGQLMQEDCLRWAFERRLVYDFGYGDEPYKLHWANRESQWITYFVPLSLVGLAALFKAKAAYRIKSLLRRLSPRGGQSPPQADPTSAETQPS